MDLFKKRRAQSEPEPAVVEDQPVVGKGRPTPKRKAAEAKGLRPVVPADRKAAKREAQAARDAAWERQREAMRTGDERYLPARDKGPIKRYVRDYIDARFCIGEVFMPLTLVLMLLMFAFSSWLGNTGIYAMLSVYAVFFLAIADSVLCWLLVRRRLVAAFGAEEVRKAGGIFFYVFMRCMQVRRWRQPSPLVARGDYPS